MNRIICGDVLEVLPTIEAGSVQCCVTSPPYWGLRDYGTAEWEGGEDGCDHLPSGTLPTSPDSPGRRKSTLNGTTKTTLAAAEVRRYRDTCGKCGAKRLDNQLGLEPTPEEYVAKMVAVFREVRRVLREDGTLWLNLGDSYNAYNANRGPSTSISDGNNGRDHPAADRGLSCASLKPKDLCGIPWRVAFALQADGWWLRQDIIWAKPNPMPESCTDRCTKAHEYIFLLTKSARYYYDADAIAESRSDSNESRFRAIQKHGGAGGGEEVSGAANPDNPYYHHAAKRGLHGVGTTFGGDPGKRNARSVWTITTQPYPGAHFATFPPKLIEPCILAGCKEGGVVLDPFIGSGTVAEVARKNGCKYLGIELNAEYIKLAEKRLAQGVLPFE